MKYASDHTLISQEVYEEFFQQGDLEKKIGHSPQALLDRNKAAELPKMQV